MTKKYFLFFIAWSALISMQASAACERKGSARIGRLRPGSASEDARALAMARAAQNALSCCGTYSCIVVSNVITSYNSGAGSVYAEATAYAVEK